MDPTSSNTLSDDERVLVERFRAVTDPEVRAALLLIAQIFAEYAKIGGA